MQKYETYAEWWAAEGKAMDYQDLSLFEISQRAWLVSQSTTIRNNNKEK